MKKLLAAILCGAMVLSLAACGGGSESTASGTTSGGGAASGEAASGGSDTLRVINQQDPGTFDPAGVDDQSYFQVVRQIYEPLFKLNNDGTVENWLCEEYSYDDDTHLRVTLRDVQFSDGTPLTAEDVLWSLQRIRDETLPAISAIQGINFEECQVVDDKTLVIATDGPQATLLARLAYPGTGIASKAAHEAAGGDWLGGAAIGTGPYALKEYVAGDRTEYVANENYWREGEPKVPNLQMRHITDDTTRATEAKALGADIIYTINSREIDAVEAVEGMHVVEELGTNTTYLMLNSKMAPLDDPAVREAITYAINVQQTVDLIYGDFGSAGSGMVAPGVLGYDETSFQEHYGHGYDPETAKQMLADAGYPDGIELTMLTDIGDSTRNDIAEAFQAQMAPAGITLNIVMLENVVLYNRVAQGDQHHMVLYGLTCSDFEADGLLNQILPGSSNSKMTGFDDPHFVELINIGASTMDRTEREQAWKDALNYLAEADVMIPVWHKALVAAVGDNVEGFELCRDYEEHYLQGVSLS